MESKNEILLIDDDAAQRTMMSRLIERTGFSPVQASGGGIALHLLQEKNDIRLVLLDVNMPEMDGMEVLEAIRQRFPALPVIMLTAGMDIALAVQAMKTGACDFLTKPAEPERLSVSIHNALRLNALEKECSQLKRRDAFTFDNLIGSTGGLSGTVRTGRKAAASDIPVLLTGETGVGKEAFAQAIHGESLRTGKPFVAVNCGALPAQLVESALFGHEKGSFTGAIAKSLGRFREAEGGTIFLDEIGELPLEAQVKLLRVLQQKEVTPVGAGRPVRINVRIISATNRDLETEVAAGRFRGDLYFRLNVLQIKIPALRERSADIPALARHFIERFSVSESRPPKNISPEALDRLMHGQWPGNVRELENALHRAMILSEKTTLEMEDLPSPAPAVPAAIPETCLSLLNHNGNLKTLDEVERAVMEFSLTYSRNNITRAAHSLGVAKSTFYRKLQEFHNKNI